MAGLGRGDYGRRLWGIWAVTIGRMHYRTYALDFWGFGESGKKRETYAVQDFVSLVDQFMDQLGIMHAPLVGHSMGGTVSLSVAIRFPERVSKVVVVGSPMVGSSLAPLLKLLGLRPVAFMLFNMMGLFRAGMRVYSPFICSDPPATRASPP
jgi:pimeloyl-ACP methyl ester carboxylesterase